MKKNKELSNQKLLTSILSKYNEKKYTSFTKDEILYLLKSDGEIINDMISANMDLNKELNQVFELLYDIRNIAMKFANNELKNDKNLAISIARSENLELSTDNKKYEDYYLTKNMQNEAKGLMLRYFNDDVLTDEKVFEEIFMNDVSTMILPYIVSKKNDENINRLYEKNPDLTFKRLLTALNDGLALEYQEFGDNNQEMYEDLDEIINTPKKTKRTKALRLFDTRVFSREVFFRPVDYTILKLEELTKRKSKTEDKALTK